MLIKGLQKLSLIDYPGKVTATIFLFGCNFRCPYCHNPELLSVKKSKKVKTYSEKEILKFLHERKNFLEGVCITGGEPTLNPELPEFIKKIKEMGFKIKLDTNGTNPGMLKNLIQKKLVDYIAMDVKAPPSKYKGIVKVRVDIGKIKESIEIIKKFPCYEFRITVVPDLITKQDLIKIGKILKGSKFFYIQQFRPFNCLEKSYNRKKTYNEKQLKDFKNSIKRYFKKVEIRMETY